MFKWTNVKDRLPNKNGKYLCVEQFLGEKDIHIYSFTSEFPFDNRPGWYEYDSEYGFHEVCNVTHWTELPELPTDLSEVL